MYGYGCVYGADGILRCGGGPAAPAAQVVEHYEQQQGLLGCAIVTDAAQCAAASACNCVWDGSNAICRTSAVGARENVLTQSQTRNAMCTMNATQFSAFCVLPVEKKDAALFALNVVANPRSSDATNATE